MSSRSCVKHLVAAVLASTVLVSGAHAAILDLSQYRVSIARSLGGSENQSGIPEASTVTYDWDRDSLMVLGDEGAGGNEYSKDGANYPGVLQYRALRTPTRGPTLNDSEGITYVGNGQFIVAEERTTNLVKISVDPSRTIDTGPANGNEKIYYFTLPDPAFTYKVSGGPDWGNEGLEGITYDPTTGGFFGIRSDAGQRVMFIDWDFNTANSAGTTTDLFDPASLGLTTLSDIATLSTVAAFKGNDFRDNLLILSASSERLVEVTRTGELVSSFDLSGIINSELGRPITRIEGVTLDNDGNIYLVSEMGGFAEGSSESAFIKLERQAAAVPEPATWAMMITGLGMVGGTLRRRKVAVRSA